MDLHTITSMRRPHGRNDLALAPGEAVLGGGSWLFSEPQNHLTGLVDLTALDWPPLTVTQAGLSIAATCTMAELAAMPDEHGWAAHPLFRRCCEALLGSFKVWSMATVGGNIALALPAGPMTSLAAALDADAVVWTADGETLRIPVSELVTGVQETRLAPGDVIRSIEIGADALASRTAFRRIALSELGRSGTLVIGRLAPSGAFTLTVTAGTRRPVVLRYAALPSAPRLADDVSAIDDWYDDAHGAPDWRRAMSARFAAEIRDELAVVA